MPTIEDKPFASWDHFKSRFREYLPSGYATEDFVFRGQADVDWKLRPSFTRTFGSGKPAKDTWKLQYEILQHFVREVRLSRLPSHDLIPEDFDLHLRRFESRMPWTRKRNTRGEDALLKACIKIWAHGQHYGLPTPLLDWTTSPYVAAFFAYESAFQGQMHLSSDEIKASRHRVAVFALNTRAVQDWKKMGVTWATDLGNTENTRIKNQRGLFTLLPVTYADLDDCVIEYCTRSRPAVPIDTLMIKMSFPYCDAIHAIRDLELMDLNARRIYNDWGGVCSAANMKSLLALRTS